MLKEVKLKNGNTVLKGVTPKGTFEYAKFNEPQVKIGDQIIDPTYSATLYMDGNDPAVQTFIKQLDDELKKAEAMAQNNLKGRRGKLPTCHDENFGDEVSDDGTPTGRVYIKAKCKAEGTTASGKVWKFKPAVFDAHGVPFPQKDPPMVGNGSVGKLSITAFAYAAPIGYGVSIRLEAAQVIELVEYGGRKASDYGFETEEGYTVEEQTPFTAEDDYGEQPKSYREEKGDF